jgi:hypothetical protein
MWIDSNCCKADDGQHDCQQDKHASEDFFLFKDEKKSQDYENQAVYKESNNHFLLMKV